MSSKMRLHLVLAKFPDSEGTEYPEVVECWDEFCIEGNQDGWEEARKKALNTYQEEGVMYREAIVITHGLPELFDTRSVLGEEELLKTIVDLRDENEKLKNKVKMLELPDVDSKESVVRIDSPR